ncbi:hypothetical protein BR93DRAFT_688070 [Coniochaeta sp. PMI_546]|nr:hypothetical protein BR93DRAFT_688070 [Coniochaeta sp. PMI_546]
MQVKIGLGTYDVVRHGVSPHCKHCAQRCGSGSRRQPLTETPKMNCTIQPRVLMAGRQ